MKKLSTMFFAIALACAMLSGCFYGYISAGEPREDINYEDMEIYKSLHGAVTEESTLEEMLTAFEEMSEIPVDSVSNMFLYEVYSYEMDGADYLLCHIVRQVDEPGTTEYIQLHLDITYLLEEDMRDFKTCVWYDNDPMGFLNHIRNGEIYRTLEGKPIHSRLVSIDSTW